MNSTNLEPQGYIWGNHNFTLAYSLLLIFSWMIVTSQRKISVQFWKGRQTNPFIPTLFGWLWVLEESSWSCSFLGLKVDTYQNPQCNCLFGWRRQEFEWFLCHQLLPASHHLLFKWHKDKTGQWLMLDEEAKLNDKRESGRENAKSWDHKSQTAEQPIELLDDHARPYWQVRRQNRMTKWKLYSSSTRSSNL